MSTTTYEVYKNAMIKSGKGWHICTVNNGIICSEEVAIRNRGSFKTLKSALAERYTLRRAEEDRKAA